jgi:F420-non-reducing hydrogenase large subunit
MTMAKKIVISPVSRIEGHLQIVVQLDDAGNVSDTKVQTVNLRGFEEFCKGRPVEELPRITTSICGVCPSSHHLASVKAVDGCFGATPTTTGIKLRELMEHAHYVEEHILHFYFLAGADFVMGPGAEVKDRNIFGIIKKLPNEAKLVVKARWSAAQIAETVGGRSIHPVAGVPGGWSKPLRAEQKEKCLKWSEPMMDLAKFSIKYAKDNIFPNYQDAIKTIGAIKTGFLGMVGKNGEMNLYDGKLRMMQANGEFREFEGKDYHDHIKEAIMPWSYTKFPYDAKAGKLSLDYKNPVGVYRTNTLARINVAEKFKTPLAQAEFEEFRKNFGRPAQNSMLYHWARLIELLYAAEYVQVLLKDKDITGTDTRSKVEQPQAARGVGVVEAPRGTLIHDYTTDEKGLVKELNLIVGTTHNLPAINMSVRQTADAVIKNGKYDQGTLNMLEMAIRAYDPCISCATHNLDGSIATVLSVFDHNGKRMKTLRNY